MKKHKTLMMNMAYMAMVGLFVLTPVFAMADKGGQSEHNNGRIKATISSTSTTSVVKAHMGKDDDGDKDDIRVYKNATSSPQDFKNFGQFVSWFQKWFHHGQNATTTILSITNIGSTVGTNTATIGWTTSESVASEIHYSTTSTVTSANTAVTDTTLTKNHSASILGLLPDTTYYYVVFAHDALGNNQQSQVMSFHTNPLPASDTTAPTILFQTPFGTNASSSRIIWVTSEPANSKVWVSTTSSVTTSVLPIVSSNTLSYFHDMAVGSLATSTTYYYTITTTDASGNTATSTGGSFTTLAL